MPSPVGHALAGYAVGTLVAGPAAVVPTEPSRAALLNRSAWFAVLGCLPDVDFLFGAHSMYTHSVGAVLVIAAIAAVAARVPARVVVACAAAYGSHPLLDWLGHDTNPPIGIMALWPFSSGYYTAPIPILLPVSRRFDWPYFWSHNLKVVSLEILVFGTIAVVAYFWRGRPFKAGAP